MFALTPYEHGNMLHTNPFELFGELERSFLGTDRHALRTDIRDEGRDFVLEAELPGFEKKDIQIQVEGDSLTIQANRTDDSGRRDTQGRYICRERSYDSYMRRFDVSGVKTDEIRASYENGILKLSLPKKEQAHPESRQISLG